MKKVLLVVVGSRGITFRELKNMEKMNHLSEHEVRAFLDRLVEEGSVEIKSGIIQAIPRTGSDMKDREGPSHE